MPLITLATIAELPFDFSILEGSVLGFSFSSSLLTVVSSLFRLFRSCTSICWMSSKVASELWNFAPEPPYADGNHYHGVVGHVGRYSPCLLRANSGRGSITAGFSFIVWPLEEASQWFQRYSLCERKGLSIVVEYCYPRVGTSGGTFWFNQNLT